MSATLTIRKLDAEVKQKLRLRAAAHERSMEAEAREILTRAVGQSENEVPVPADSAKTASPVGKFDHLVGIWKGRGMTDQIMKELRDDE